jgi:hypothetical protein
VSVPIAQWYCYRPLSRTATPTIHWIAPIIAGVPFGAGVAMILQSLTTYLMDTYPLYFASSVASTIVLRSCFGAGFPLFSPKMFETLGDQWAMSLFGFLAVGCMPIPMLFFVGPVSSGSKNIRVTDASYINRNMGLGLGASHAWRVKTLSA